MTGSAPILRRSAVLAVAALALFACALPGRPGAQPTDNEVLGGASPSPTPRLSGSSAASRSPTATPSPTLTTSVSRTTRPRPAGDLTITLGGGCTWYLDTEGHLWLNPTLWAKWTGPVPWPPNAFNMTANYGKHTAGGLVPESTGFDTDPDPRRARYTWAIGGEDPSVYAGHTVKLTVKIDVVGPIGEVYETDETNNTAIIQVIVPPTGYSTTELPVSCGLL